MPDVAGLSPAVGLLAGGIAAISGNTIDGRLGSIDWTIMRMRLLKGKSFSRKHSIAMLEGMGEGRDT